MTNPKLPKTKIYIEINNGNDLGENAAEWRDKRGKISAGPLAESSGTRYESNTFAVCGLRREAIPTRRERSVIGGWD